MTAKRSPRRNERLRRGLHRRRGYRHLPGLLLVAGILGIIGLILGFIGRGRAKRGEATNGTMALWGIITSAVAVVISIIGAVILVGVFAALSEEPSVETENTVSPAVETSAPTQAQETAPPGAEEVDVFDLEVGDCLTEIQATEGIVSVQTVACSEPRSDEIITAATLLDGDGNYPGVEAISAQAEERYASRNSRASSDCPMRNRFLSSIIWHLKRRSGTPAAGRSSARSTTRPARSAGVSAASSARQASE